MPTLLDLAYDGNYAGSTPFASVFTYYGEAYMVGRITGWIYRLESPFA
jgi:hypothetical protein